MGLKLLVVSDSHDNLKAVNELVGTKRFNESDYIIHLGDIISPFTLVKFLEAGKPFTGIFGNNDGDKSKLKELCRTLQEQPMKISLSGLELTLFHGFGTPDTTREVIYSLARERAASSGSELILYGHTHKAEIRKFGKVLVVNPGALSGYLTDRKTYALIDLGDKELRASVFDLETGEAVINEAVIYG